MKKPIVIHWFRQDLRLTDNPAFYNAANAGIVLPIYIFDEDIAKEFKIGAASRWWLHHSLENLNQSLENFLAVFQGESLKTLQSLIKKYQISKVFWNRCYEPWRIKQDAVIKKTLEQQGVTVETYNGSLLWEPWENLKSDGTPYKVFTPFYKKGCLGNTAPRKPLNNPKNLTLLKEKNGLGAISKLNLLPKITWYEVFEQHWNIGEQAAKKRLQNFLESGLKNYKEGRNFPAQEHVSHLSPYLHFGEISPNQIWYAAQQANKDENLTHFLTELGWREFSYSLLFHFPELPLHNLQKKFDAFPWRQDIKKLKLWQQGKTGYPIIDAGMRELWQTGYMHNRVRMIVGSFLVKNLLLHWHHGEKWFWDCLVDADLANNSASWQWVAGCGADAAPYFRIFNPVTQGKKFDPQGEYTLKYVPELAKIPKKYLFNPWDAPTEILTAANIKLGQTYPKPIIDLNQSRKEALAALKSITNLDS